MKWIKYIILTVGLWSIGSPSAKAQIDTTFYFAAPWVTPDHWWRDPIAFHFSTFSNPTTINLRQPAGTYDTTFTVPANTLFTKYVTHLLQTFDVLESKPADAILTTGFEITSDYPITVVYDIITRPTNYYNPETYSLKGQNGMGYEFVTPFQTLWDNKTLTGDLNGDAVITQPYQQFQVVATEDNTIVWITPACDIIGHPAGETFSITLPFKGCVYTAQNVTQNTNVYGNNMAGSIVVADKPVSVTVSDDSVNPAGGGGCYDLMGDQIVPTDVIGTDYIVNKGDLNAGSDESIFVVATENFTTINIDDGVTTASVIINQGDTYQFSITQQLTYVTADKNVYLLHMSGYGCELGEAILPPLNCAGSDQISFARANSQAFYLNITVPSGSEGNFTLNGSTTLITAADFSPVPGTAGAWMGTQKLFNTTDVPVGTANLITNSTDLFSLGIFNGGPTTGCLYHYLSSFLRRVYVDAGLDTTLCTGTATIDLVGSVSGGTTTGLWTVLDGTNTIPSPTNLTTTYTPTASDFAQGYLTFVLESTGNCDPRYDTMKVTFIESPVVDAGLDDVYCKNNVGTIPLNGTLAYAVGSEWSGGTGGSFADISDLSTTYTPSPTDLAADSILIFLTSSGSFFSCPNDEDTLVIYFTNPPTVVAGPDQVVCSSDSLVTLNGLVSGPTTTGIWTTSGSGAFDPSELLLSTDYLMSSADTTAGVVTLVLTSTANGACVAESDSLVVTILDKPTVIITSTDSICANAVTLDLSGTMSAGYSSLWTTSGSGSIADDALLSTSYTISPLDTATGYIDVFLSTVGGICPVEYDSMRVYFQEPPIAYAGPDTSFCENEPAALNGMLGGSAFSGSWTSMGTGSFDPSPDLLSTYYYPSGLDVSNGFVNLILTTSASYGCLPDKDTITLTYLEAPVADFSYDVACEGENTLFTDLSSIGSGSVTEWTYSFGDGDSSIAANPNHPFPGSGSYQVVLIAEASNGCSDTVTQTVWVNPVPVANFTHNYACQGEKVNFIDQSFLASGTIASWDWEFVAPDTSVLQHPDYVFVDAGTFPVTLTVTSDSGCTNSITQDVIVLAGPTAAFTMTPNPVLALEEVYFTDESTNGPITSWYWDFGDNLGDNIQNPTHVYSSGGYFDVILEVADTAGCTDTAMQTIHVILGPQLPTAFTPNGDGENDVYIIRGGPFASVDFKIYNNWGQLVFSTTDPDEGWDGEYLGAPAQLGVYTWTYQVIIDEGMEPIYGEGDVTLIR